jgi:predicted small secreted protein
MKMLGNTRPHKGFGLGLVPVVLAVLFSLAACNTIEGMGKDIERGGEGIQGGSKDVKEKM